MKASRSYFSFYLLLVLLIGSLAHAQGPSDLIGEWRAVMYDDESLAIRRDGPGLVVDRRITKPNPDHSWNAELQYATDGTETRSLYRLPDDRMWIEVANSNWLNGVLEIDISWVTLSGTHQMRHRYYLNADQDLVREEIGPSIEGATATSRIVFAKVLQ